MALPRRPWRTCNVVPGVTVAFPLVNIVPVIIMDPVPADNAAPVDGPWLSLGPAPLRHPAIGGREVHPDLPIRDLARG